MKKILVSLKNLGIKKTIYKIYFEFIKIITLKNFKQKKNTIKILKLKSIDERFAKIYSTNYWSDNESKSGSGSSFKSTENIRLHLPIIIKKFNIKNIFDAPCGDFNWMRYVLRNLEINYLGADIVEDIISFNKKEYENNKIKFNKLDIRIDKLPKADLMILRDCLFHFSYEDIKLFFKNFLSSEIKYILITSHLNSEYKFENRDITTGDYRLIDIFTEPFSFEKNYIYTFDDRDQLEIKNFKQMYLFSRLKIEKNLTNI